MNLLLLESERRFEEFCQALLREEFPRFQAFSPPDAGMDGYESDLQTIFQAYFPEGAPRRDKIRADLEKARQHRERCKRWVLLLPKNPTLALLRWLEKNEQPSCAFKIEVWGKTEISARLRKHPDVKEQFFPSEWRKELRRIAKGKGPCEGDAAPGVRPAQPAAPARLRLPTDGHGFPARRAPGGAR